MGMIFASEAVVYIVNQLNTKFDASANGLIVWQQSSNTATEFRDSLASSKTKKAPALGSITIEYLNLDIPDSDDANVPGDDPFNGKSYRRWIYFWNKFRKKFPSAYKGVIEEILKVLENNEPAVKGLIFDATPANNNSEVGIVTTYMQHNGLNYKLFTLLTKPWDTV